MSDNLSAETAKEPEPSSASASTLKSKLSKRGKSGPKLEDYGIAFAFMLMGLILSLTSDVFLTKANVLNLLEQSAPIGIMAAAGTIVFIAGGFDLSVGALLTLSGVITAWIAQRLGIAPACMIGLLIGLLGGLLNGVLVTVAKVNAFVTTLATMIIFRGLALAVTGGSIIAVRDRAFTEIGRGDLFGVAYQTWIWFGFALLCAGLLNMTLFGRYAFACGDNVEAARLSGVKTNLVRAGTFALSGLAAGIAGVLIASRSASGAANAGTGLELTVIAAVVIGGTSLSGGEGAIWRSVIGVLILSMINNAFVLLNVSSNYQQVVMGSVILLAVGIDSWSRGRSM